jgi:peroxiredoxin
MEKRLMEREAAPAPGESAPDFTLTDTEGASWHLDERVATQRVLLIFYRGQW